MHGDLRSIELCAGGGGQALGVEQAGFAHVAVVEIDKHAVQTLRDNRPGWNVVQADLKEWSAKEYRGQVDLLAAGLPCPPFSKAGKQLGAKDERNLFPAALRIIREVMPTAVMIENVRGLLDAVFEDFRGRFQRQVERLGYKADWKLLQASDFGVPQLRPRVVFVALKKDLFPFFEWPKPTGRALTVGEALYSQMKADGWTGADAWRDAADEIAPTLVGGSAKHGGPDLGPTRAKRAWAALGVDANVLANEPPPKDYVGMPRLTVEMCATIQGFPRNWKFSGKKTNAYRQVGNAFPPPVAKAVARKIKKALEKAASVRAAA